MKFNGCRKNEAIEIEVTTLSLSPPGLRAYPRNRSWT